MKFAFINEHKTYWPIVIMCRVLRVSRSGYHAWCKRPDSARARRHRDLAKKIRAIYNEDKNYRVYGSPRIYQELAACGEKVCENTVAKVMRDQGLRAKTAKKFAPCTTDSNHNKPVADNILNRDFTAHATNQKWAVDITYIPTDEGWLYLSGVMDLYSRKIVGWSMADHMQSSLVEDALTMAIIGREPGRGLLHHSDRGSQYAGDDYQKLLDDNHLAVSMSRKGNCWDNAAKESFWATLKKELVHDEHYATHEQARASIFKYIEIFYNRKRRHSSLGYVSPEAFEAGQS